MSEAASLSRRRRDDIIGALRRGVVPEQGLGHLAVGLERFEDPVGDEFDGVEGGSGVFKAVRGEYGSGKTFFSRWLQERARKRGWVTAQMQVSETETPLHRLETVYRRLIERLATEEVAGGALRSILDAWFYALEEDVLAEGTLDEADTEALLKRTEELAESRLASISQKAPAFSAALRTYRRCLAEGDQASAEGLLAWVGLSSDPRVNRQVDALLSGGYRVTLLGFGNHPREDVVFHQLGPERNSFPERIFNAVRLLAARFHSYY